MDLINDTGNTDLSQLIKEMDSPKQSFPTPGFIDDKLNDTPKTEILNLSTNTTVKDSDVDKDFKKISKKYFRIGDMILVQIASWISGESKKRVSLDKEDSQYIMEVLEDVAEDNDWNDPGSLPILVLMVLVAYGGVFSDAFKIRKTKQEAKNLLAKDNYKDNDVSLKRKCPDCNSEIEYQSKTAYINAIQNNSRCDKCKNKE